MQVEINDRRHVASRDGAENHGLGDVRKARRARARLCRRSGVSGGVERLGNGFDDGGTRKVDANYAQVAAKFWLFLCNASHRSQRLLRREVERECSLKFLARDSVEDRLTRHGLSESPFGVIDNPSTEGVRRSHFEQGRIFEQGTHPVWSDAPDAPELDSLEHPARRSIAARRGGLLQLSANPPRCRPNDLASISPVRFPRPLNRGMQVTLAWRIT